MLVSALYPRAVLLLPDVLLNKDKLPSPTFPPLSYTLAPELKLASVVSLIVEIAELLVLMLVVFVLISDSTSVMFPIAKVPSISASLRTVTVPVVWPRDRSPVEKSPEIKLTYSMSDISSFSS